MGHGSSFGCQVNLSNVHSWLQTAISGDPISRPLLMPWTAPTRRHLGAKMVVINGSKLPLLATNGSLSHNANTSKTLLLMQSLHIRGDWAQSDVNTDWKVNAQRLGLYSVENTKWDLRALQFLRVRLDAELATEPTIKVWRLQRYYDRKTRQARSDFLASTFLALTRGKIYLLASSKISSFRPLKRN